MQRPDLPLPRLAILALTALALVGVAAAVAQDPKRGLWPNDASNPKAHVAGKFDYYTLVMSWSPTHCVTAQEGRDEEQCARIDGLRYGFVLHGLWPQYEQGYPEACRIGRKPFVPRPVINSMLDIMPSGGLVIHEFKLHGTCSGLDPENYYKLSRRMFTGVRIPDRFKNPFETQFTSPREIEAEFMRANPWLRPEMMAVTCGGPGNRLRDVRICLTRNGEGRACGQNENQHKLCRTDQVHVPPVRSTRRDNATSSTKNLQPQRDRGLPRPRVIEAPARF
jgi:ribonuclease T2